MEEIIQPKTSGKQKEKKAYWRANSHQGFLGLKKQGGGMVGPSMLCWD